MEFTVSAKRIRLTAEIGQQIVAAIRAGGYPHVAAEAVGVPKEDFDDWLKRGSAKIAWEPYRTFANDVRQAFAQARLLAEVEGYKKDPKAWLIHGPGRESEQQPGWSTSVKPAEAHEQGRNVLLDAELMALFGTLLEVLRPFPEARRQAAEVLSKVGVASKP